MKELIPHIAKALVDNPDQVVVEEITSQQTLVLELRVSKEDIGKKGRTAKAMRTILSCTQLLPGLQLLRIPIVALVILGERCED